MPDRVKYKSLKNVYEIVVFSIAVGLQPVNWTERWLLSQSFSNDFGKTYFLQEEPPTGSFGELTSLLRL